MNTATQTTNDAIAVPTTIAIERIRIGEDEIHGVRDAAGQPWVVLRRACEVLGLDPEGQRQKLDRTDWACTCIMKAHDASGRGQDHFCLSVESVPMWLATIDAGRCLLEARPKIVRFQTALKAWHEHVPSAASICLIRGRVSFLLGGGDRSSATFASALILWSRSLEVNHRFILEMSRIGQVLVPV